MHILWDNFVSYILSSLFGVFLTILVFYLTSHPTTAETIKRRLRSIILKRLHAELGRAEPIEPEITNFVAQEFDVHPLKSIVMFGVWEPKKNVEWYRWVGIFEPKEPRLLDKLIGRPGFYELKSLIHMEAIGSDSLVPSKVELVDFDGDGIPEVHVTLKSTWADAASIGPLILRKCRDGAWQALALPSIAALTRDVLLEGKFPHPANVRPIGHPFTYFGKDEDPAAADATALNDLKGAGVYEDDWTLTHNGAQLQFVTLRNGGKYEIRRHPLKHHWHIGTVAFFADGTAVLGAHYAVVNFLSLGENGLSRDLLWNWGFPMISRIPLRPTDIDLESIAKAGIVAHLHGDIFFGYTEFERSTIDQKAWGVRLDQSSSDARQPTGRHD